MIRANRENSFQCAHAGQDGLYCPILAFNVIEELIRESSKLTAKISLVDLLWQDMTLHWNSGYYSVFKLRWVTVPHGQIQQIICYLKAFPRADTMLFNPVPEGLELLPAVVNVPPET